jgi:hypothetical protein
MPAANNVPTKSDLATSDAAAVTMICLTTTIPFMLGDRDVHGDARVAPVVVDRMPSVEPIFRSRPFATVVSVRCRAGHCGRCPAYSAPGKSDEEI